MKKDITILAIGFFMIFLGFNTLQQYFTIAYAQSGLAILSLHALAITYIFFFTGSFIAPLLIEKIGLRNALIAGGAGYVLFIGIIPLKSVPIVIAAAAINGICAALIWISEGAYVITSTDEKNRAAMLGIVNAAAFGGSFIGILATSLIVNTIGFDRVFNLLALSAAIGTVTFVFLTNKKTQIEKTPLLGALSLARTKAALFIPLFFATLMTVGFFVSTIMVHLQTTQGTEAAGKISSIFWLAAIITSFAAGTVATKIGNINTLRLIAGLLIVSAILFFTGNQVAVMIAAAIWGAYLATVLNVGLAAVSTISTNKNQVAAFFQFCLQPGAVFAFVMAGVFDYTSVLYLIIGAGMLSLLALIFVKDENRM